jgi:putative endonuclease
MYTVYILQSLKDRRHYIGYTMDLEQRLKQHNSGKTASLKSRLPMTVVYTEKCETLSTAKAREKQIKSYKGGEAFKQLFRFKQ